MTYSLGNASADRPQNGAVAMMCSGYETGFELNPIQGRAAVATPSQWGDFVVTAVAADGWIDLVSLDEQGFDGQGTDTQGRDTQRAGAQGRDSQATSRVWHYESTGLSVGEPVALHGKYSVLAVGSALFSVRVS